MTKLLFDPNHCVVAIATEVDGVQKFNLYDPMYFNYCAAVLTGEAGLNPEETLHQKGYCGIIADKLKETELFDTALSVTAAEAVESFCFEAAIDITGCSLDEMYNYVIAALDNLALKLVPTQPTVH